MSTLFHNICINLLLLPKRVRFIIFFCDVKFASEDPSNTTSTSFEALKIGQDYGQNARRLAVALFTCSALKWLSNNKPRRAFPQQGLSRKRGLRWCRMDMMFLSSNLLYSLSNFTYLLISLPTARQEHCPSPVFQQCVIFCSVWVLTEGTG